MINILLPKDFETFAFFGGGVPDIFKHLALAFPLGQSEEAKFHLSL